MKRELETHMPPSDSIEAPEKTSEDASNGLNENHKNRLLLTFEHVDKQLGDALHELNSAGQPSPFQRRIPDSLPIQRKVMADYLARFRRIMTDILERFDIQPRKPTVSAVWAFRVAAMYAKTDIEELAPKYMRGYGGLSAAAAHDLDVLKTELCAALDQMDNYLAGGAGKDLRDRLRKLEQTSHEVEWLALLEEVITAQGLVSLRPALDALIERMESGDLEVAVFGRVSSGKSSLLNHILQTHVLPVGVTPVTAVPTRVGYGSHAQARIAFAERDPITVEPTEIPSYATEQANPDNVRHVTRIQVELPIERLKGVTFVDTPGLGSVSRNGELESLAYLPRCDIGIMLVDASSTLTPEDAAVIQALYQAGADVMVILNKADMLAAEERATSMRYVADRLRTDLGQDAPVYLVSVKGNDAVLCDQWFETALVPRLNEHRDLARISLRRKVGLLRDAAVLALQRRLKQSSVADGGLARHSEGVAQALREGLASLETGAGAFLDLRGADFVEQVLDAATRTMVAGHREENAPDFDVGATVLAVAHDYANQVAVAIAKDLEALRENLLRALRSADADSDRTEGDNSALPVSSAMPAPQFSLPSGTPLRKSAIFVFDAWFGGWILRRYLGKRLTPWLTESFDHYIAALRRWRSETVTEMRRTYSASMELCLAGAEQGPEGIDLVHVERDLDRLQIFDKEDDQRQ
jgi:GTP-binding protein EngB required for normal cell division